MAARGVEQVEPGGALAPRAERGAEHALGVGQLQRRRAVAPLPEARAGGAGGVEQLQRRRTSGPAPSSARTPPSASRSPTAAVPSGRDPDRAAHDPLAVGQVERHAAVVAGREPRAHVALAVQHVDASGVAREAKPHGTRVVDKLDRAGADRLLLHAARPPVVVFGGAVSAAGAGRRRPSSRSSAPPGCSAGAVDDAVLAWSSSRPSATLSSAAWIALICVSTSMQ